MTDESLARKSARELAALIKSRAVSPVEVLDAHLAVIARVNPKLNAIVTLVADQARAAAQARRRAVMRGDQVGPLHGLPIAVKDVTLTAGIRTTFGSPLYKDQSPTRTPRPCAGSRPPAPSCWARPTPRNSPPAPIPSTTLFGATRNPWNPALSSAGSSGGSAVAVATGMVPIAQGTDFGGSVRVAGGVLRHRRNPRPTPGLTPNYPAALAWDPGQVHGPLARTRRGRSVDARCHGRA